MPQLRGVNAIVFAVTVIDSLRTFDIVWAMTRGGPYHSSELLSTVMYQQAFTFLNLGYASALAVVIFALAIVFIITYLVRSAAAGGLTCPRLAHLVPSAARGGRRRRAVRRRGCHVVMIPFTLLWIAPMVFVLLIAVRSFDDMAEERPRRAARLVHPRAASRPRGTEGSLWTRLC